MFSKNKNNPDQILPEYCNDALHDIRVLLKNLSSSDKDIHISHSLSLSLVIKSCLTLATPCQAPLSTGFSRQEYWSIVESHLFLKV